MAGTTKCDECGAELSEINLWPFCGGDPTKHAKVTMFGEDPIEGYVDDNLQHDPVEITTRAQRRKIMSKNGLEYRDVSRKKRGKTLYFFHGKSA